MEKTLWDIVEDVRKRNIERKAIQRNQVEKLVEELKTMNVKVTIVKRKSK